MAKFIVTGGRPLSGSYRISGAKNAVLPILAACVVAQAPVELRDCPRLTDVDNMVGILSAMGCRIQRRGDALFVDSSGADSAALPEQLSKELRSSIFLLGPVLARFGRANVAYPGGCEIGNRPIDLHLDGLRRLGVEIRETGGRILCTGEKLTGADVHLDYPSVGATENLMMAAVAARGETVISNAAREPEIRDLQGFLCAAGFDVRGAGSSTVTVRGGCKPRPVVYTIMPDRIVAGTLLVAAAVTGGALTLTNTVPADMAAVLAKLRESGCDADWTAGQIALAGPRRPRALKLVETLPHPGFPTDMQAQIFALCALAEGTSFLVENVFENRFKHAQELSRMGADSTVRARTAVIRGVPRLTGAQVTAHDLRGGAALVLAGLAADGVTTVENAFHVDRGYERLETILTALGANILREETY